MAPISQTIGAKINKVILGKPFLKKEGKACGTNVKYEESTISSRFNQHTANHKENVSKSSRFQTLLSMVAKAEEDEKKRLTFNAKITQALTAANIPLETLRNPVLRKFLAEETGQKIQGPSTCRHNVKEQYESKLSEIGRIVGDQNVYFVIDETTDACQRYVVNDMVGLLNGEESKPLLLDVQFVEKTNNETIQDVVLKACKILWPDKIKYENLILMLSDQAAYMLKAGRMLKKPLLYPNLHHITCLAHSLHVLADHIRISFSVVNSYIVKVLMGKSYKRKADFKAQTGLSLPPIPVMTRRGTFLNAVKYHTENLSEIKQSLVSYEADSDTNALVKLKNILDKAKSEQQLFGLNKYTIISDYITKLEKETNIINEQLQIVANTRILITGSKFADKLESSLSENPDLFRFTISTNLTDMLARNKCPLVSVSVERSFSKYKKVLRDDRRSSTGDNLKYLLILFCNHA